MKNQKLEKRNGAETVEPVQRAKAGVRFHSRSLVPSNLCRERRGLWICERAKIEGYELQGRRFAMSG